MYVTVPSKSNEVVVSQSEKCAICRMHRVHTSALNVRPTYLVAFARHGHICMHIREDRTTDTIDNKLRRRI